MISKRSSRPVPKARSTLSWYGDLVGVRKGDHHGLGVAEGNSASDGGMLAIRAAVEQGFHPRPHKT